jgi:hypothetical protein
MLGGLKVAEIESSRRHDCYGSAFFMSFDEIALAHFVVCVI